MGILERIENRNIIGYLMVNNRIIFEGAIYHITQRAPGRELLFLEESDYLYFLSLLKEIVKKFRLDLFCFALLTNHLHFLLRINEKNLSIAMKNIFERYANYFNRKYQRKGHVFCGRYRLSLCNDESYILAASLYIHLNPYKAGLCEDFQEYRWSSLSLYTKCSQKTFIDYKTILNYINSDLTKARKEYVEMLRSGAHIEGGKTLDVVSVKKFVKKIARNVVKKYIQGEKGEKSLDELIEEFKSKSRFVKPEDKKARKYFIEQLLTNGYSFNEIQDILKVSRTTVYRALR